MLAFLRRYRWVVLGWTGLFAFFVVPLTTLYEWNVSKRPVVTAYVSNPQLEPKNARDGERNDVFVSLDYDRPTSNGAVHCHLDRFFLGTSGSTDANVWTIQLAVHPDSCEEPVRLPLHVPITLGEWSAIYLAGCAFSILITVVAGPLSVPSAESRKQRLSPLINPLPEPITQDLRLRLPNRQIYTDSGQQYDNAPYVIFGILSIPVIFGLAVLPFWDRVGDWPFIVAIDRILAPAISHLPDVHQLAATRRRYLIGGSAIMYGVFLSQVIVLLLSKKRRFVLLEGYDLRKAHFYKVLLITWASAGFVWYVLFFKGLENVVKSPALFAAVGAQRLLFYFFPLLVLLVGQTTTIAVIGLSRDVPHFIRRILRRRAASPV